MSALFTRKRKHVHQWSAWGRDERKHTKLSGPKDNTKFESWTELVNVRRCVLPKCGLTEERKATS